MTTNIVDGQLIFYYPHKLLFDNVQHQSAFMCKNIVSKDGDDLSERFAITDDEQPMFNLCIDETMPDVYDVMKPIMHGIEDAWYGSISGAELIEILTPPTPEPEPEPETDGETETETETETEPSVQEQVEETETGDEPEPTPVPMPDIDENMNYVVVRVQDNKAYNPNTVKLVDSALRSSIEQGVLSNFYTRVTHPELTKLSATMYVGQLQALTQRIVPLRKKTVFP